MYATFMTKQQQEDFEYVVNNLQDAIDMWPSKTLLAQLEKVNDALKSVKVFLETEPIEEYIPIH